VSSIFQESKMSNSLKLKIKNKPSTRLPVIDFSLCNECNRCIETCPHKAIVEHMNYSCSKCIKYCVTMNVPCSPKKIIFTYELCDACGLCIPACPVHAIQWFKISE
jgi:Pyruvate/2-oxoacid:ferredoxin oxidoreductase delta subunit